MATKILPIIPDELIDAIREFPAHREVEHCGQVHLVSPFAVYFTCPNCSVKMKLRALSGMPEIEDVFDAVFAWLAHPEVAAFVKQRQRELSEA